MPHVHPTSNAYRTHQKNNIGKNEDEKKNRYEMKSMLGPKLQLLFKEKIYAKCLNISTQNKKFKLPISERMVMFRA